MRFVIGFIIFLLFFLFPKDVLAVSVTVNTYPNTISSNDPFTVNLTITGAETGKNYVKIQLYKEGSTPKFFGETNNGSTWLREASGANFFPVDIPSSGPWTGDVQGRIGSPSIDEYNGSGAYKLRIQRYTSSGTTGVEDENQSAVSVTINVPTATPNPTATQAPTPTHTPTPTPKPEPTNTPTPSPTKAPTSTPTKIPSKSPTPSVAALKTTKLQPTRPMVGIRDGSGDSNLSVGKVMGSNTMNVSDKMPGVPKDTNSYNWGKLFIIIGGVVAAAGIGFLLYNNYREEKVVESDSQ